MDLNGRGNLGLFLNDNNLTGFGAEIGVRKGKFSKTILTKWTGKKLFLIDCWQPQKKNIYNDSANVPLDQQELCLKEAKTKLQAFNDRIEFVREFSVKAAKIYQDNFFDFVYIDANHSYEGVKEDLITWFPKIRSGGLFCGHDYIEGKIKGGGISGVKKAVDEFAKINGIKVNSTIEKVPSWWFFKK